MKLKKYKTKDDIRRLLDIKHLDCIVCNHPAPSDAHHITECGRRLGDDYTIPLCFDCHRGKNGFAGKNRGAWDKSLANQLILLERTNLELKHFRASFI